jgi:hypothetical protein
MPQGARKNTATWSLQQHRKQKQGQKPGHHHTHTVRETVHENREIAVETHIVWATELAACVLIHNAQEEEAQERGDLGIQRPPAQCAEQARRAIQLC